MTSTESVQHAFPDASQSKDEKLPHFWQPNSKHHEHRLKNKGQTKGWYCDVCGKNAGKVEAELTRFRCESGCDWDMCSNCMKKDRDEKTKQAEDGDADEEDVDGRMVVPMLLQRLLDNGALKPVIMATLTSAVDSGAGRPVQVGGKAILEMCRLTTLLLRKPISFKKTSSATRSKENGKHKGDWRLVDGKNSKVLEGPSASGQ